MWEGYLAAQSVGMPADEVQECLECCHYASVKNFGMAEDFFQSQPFDVGTNGQDNVSSNTVVWGGEKSSKTHTHTTHRHTCTCTLHTHSHAHTHAHYTHMHTEGEEVRSERERQYRI